MRLFFQSIRFFALRLLGFPTRLRQFKNFLTPKKHKTSTQFRSVLEASTTTTTSSFANLPLSLRIGGVFFHLFDLLALPELLDAAGQIFKWNTRTLSLVELLEARRVFADSLPYEQIRIDENSLFAKIGAWQSRSTQMGVSIFHTIHFTRQLRCSPHSEDMAWLIHELVHVAQMHHIGSRYIGEAIHAQKTAGYDYGGPNNLKGKKMCDFNREQQGDIIKHYYLYALPKLFHPKYGYMDVNIYESYVEQLKNGIL